MALGATVLGTGGGGDPYVGKLMAIEAIRKYGEVELITPDEVPDDALVCVSQMMGAPTIMVEKICSGLEPMSTYDELVRELGQTPLRHLRRRSRRRELHHPVHPGRTRRIPVIDCDLMGRAFPELQMTTLGINGVKGQPAVLADEKGNTITVRGIDDRWLEKIARQATSVMGGYTILASYPCTGRQLKDFCIPNTPTLCEKNRPHAARGARAAHRPHRRRAGRDRRVPPVPRQGDRRRKPHRRYVRARSRHRRRPRRVQRDPSWWWSTRTRTWSHCSTENP